MATSYLFSLGSYALATTVFFIIDQPWYFALPIALAALLGTSVFRALIWTRGPFGSIAKIIVGGVAIALLLWGIGSLYNALTSPFATIQTAFVGFSFLLGAALIYLAIFHEKKPT